MNYEKMEKYDEILAEICDENNCAWWDVIDGNLCDELDKRVKELGLDGDDYDDWMAENCADL